MRIAIFRTFISYSKNLCLTLAPVKFEQTLFTRHVGGNARRASVSFNQSCRRRKQPETKNIISMKKNAILWMFAAMFGIMSCLCACSDDDDNGNAGVNNGELVSDQVPDTPGWSGSTDNGVCTYTPQDADYQDYPGYYAFDFKGGVCQEAVYNMVCESAMEAQAISNFLNNGTFDDLLGDEEYSLTTVTADRKSVLGQSLQYLQALRKAIAHPAPATRADLLGISCTQSGKVVVFKLDCLKGKDGETTQYVMKAWDTGIGQDNLPDAPVFGTYDASTGRYTNNNIMGLANSRYEISTQYDGDVLTNFTTTLTLPNATWAWALEESFKEQADDYIAMFGQAPEVSRNGNQVTVKAVILDAVTREQTEDYIIVLDLMMNMPAGISFFD